MLDHDLQGPRDSDDLARLDNVLTDAGATQATRRGLLGKAAAGVAAAGGLSLVGGSNALAASKRPTTAQLKALASALATSEAFGVTFLIEAAKRAPGTPAAQFADVVQTAATQEFDHIKPLTAAGGKLLADRFWIPDAFFGPGPEPFAAVELLENVEISAYLLGVTSFANAGRATTARHLAEAMAIESEHRALARFAQTTLGKPRGVPNDRSFEAFSFQSLKAVQTQIARLGIGFGKQGTKPGKFYEYPGDPTKPGVGGKTSATRRPQ